jgi:hypothetical protein
METSARYRTAPAAPSPSGAASEHPKGWDFATSDVAERTLRQIVARALPGAQILRIVPFRADARTSDETQKETGYGAPLRIDVTCDGRKRSLVLHTASENEFGHDRRADRAGEMLLAADTFGSIPRHVEVLDVGAYGGKDGFVSLLGTGEFYLLTSHADGRPYAGDLRRIARTGIATELDELRLDELATYLAGLHATKPRCHRAVYARSVRDMVGGGEGVFGIVDGYPSDVPAASPVRLERIEEQCLAWRSRIKRKSERLARIHGDFHPFNVLFDDGTGLSVLDTSRGSVGDPADDVCAMAINFGFFALGHPNAWRSALRSLWYGFWERYGTLTNDAGLSEVAPPFLAWRGLVLANPKWYPALASDDRDRILAFVEKALGSARFEPRIAEEFFDS